MLIDVVTIFPDYLAPLELSLLGKARGRGLLEVRIHDLRSWTADVHRTVDDTPYGGGPGMVMKPEPWGEALDAVHAAGRPFSDDPPADDPPADDPPADDPPADDPGHRPVLLVPAPSGRPFTQEFAAELVAEPWLVFACGRYEGIDDRVLEDAAQRFRVVEVSLGDYVLAGGEVAVLVIVEAVARLLPGVLGNAASYRDDSFAPGAMAGLLEGPLYTRPPVWRGLQVPAVLQSGDHARIARWRRDEALRRTAARRPDLLAGRVDPGDHDLTDVPGRPGAVAE